MYPSNRPYVNVDSALLRQYWLPVFDQYALVACTVVLILRRYSLKIGFENHDHAYKVRDN